MTKPHRELLVENEKLEAEIVALKEEKGIKCKYHGSKMLYCPTCVEQIYAQGWRKEVIFYKTISRLQDAMLKYLDEQIEPLAKEFHDFKVNYPAGMVQSFFEWYDKNIARITPHEKIDVIAELMAKLYAINRFSTVVITEGVDEKPAYRPDLISDIIEKRECLSNERFGDWFNKSIVRQLKQLENPAPAPDSKTEKN